MKYQKATREGAQAFDFGRRSRRLATYDDDENDITRPRQPRDKEDVASSFRRFN